MQAGDLKKNIFLTGKTGFIGKNIAEQLAASYTILAPSHRELDLLDQSSVNQFFNSQDFSAVVHTAGQGFVPGQANSTGIAADNLRMFFNLVEALKPHQRMIFLGSGAEYDKRKDLVGVSEDQFGQSVPVDEYGFAKYISSKFIEQSQNIVSLRCFGVYGKYENSKRFISAAIISALRNQPIIVHQNVVYDFLYIDDLVKIVDYFLTNKPKEKFYNAVSGHKIDLLTLADTVKRVTSSNSEITVEQEGLQKEYTADNSRLLKEIPEMVFTGHEEAIKKLAEFYKKQNV